MLNDTDIFTSKLGDNSTTSRQVNGPSQMQLSDQAPTNADILSQHHLHSTIEREEQRQEQLMMLQSKVLFWRHLQKLLI